jgi:UDP-N-acetylglucosamine 2-epimerase (non-hydrolysing)
MIDTLLKNIDHLKKPVVWDELNLSKNNYYVLTLHRPSNVDSVESITGLLKSIFKNTQNIPVIFPVHPRTLKILEKAHLIYNNLHYIPPLNYLSFLYLVKNSKAVLTDSGGITEEASILDVPCMTFRYNTERPETCEMGTNMLVGNDIKKINRAFNLLDSDSWKKGQPIPKWDGKAALRIVDHILELYGEE